MQEFIEREQIFLLMMRGWGDHQKSYNGMDLLFSETFRRGQISISKYTVEHTIKCLEVTSSIKNCATCYSNKSQ